MHATVKLERVSLEQPAEHVRWKVPGSSVRRACRGAGFETVRGHIAVSSPFEDVADEPVFQAKTATWARGDALKKPSLTLTYSHLLSSTLISDGGILHYFGRKSEELESQTRHCHFAGRFDRRVGAGQRSALEDGFQMGA
jgi:hypothetical protein